jgi:hypothetical protein
VPNFKIGAVFHEEALEDQPRELERGRVWPPTSVEEQVQAIQEGVKQRLARNVRASDRPGGWSARLVEVDHALRCRRVALGKSGSRAMADNGINGKEECSSSWHARVCGLPPGGRGVRGGGGGEDGSPISGFSLPCSLHARSPQPTPDYHHLAHLPRYCCWIASRTCTYELGIV